MTCIDFSKRDLAPGDRRFSALDLSGLRFDRIRSISEPLFEEAYGHLWREFGHKGEMESRDALARRFDLAPQIIYEMIYVRRGPDFVAVRDHTAIIGRDGDAVVHLSHNLVAPEARRSGLAAWMRAIPVGTARECLATNGAMRGIPKEVSWLARITLLAEMEHLAPGDPQRMIRLLAYEKAGFLKIDPARISYHQPDFRPLPVIDANGGARHLPFQLILRRVAREGEPVISGAEIRSLVQALYDIYRPQCRASDIAHPLLSMDDYPATDSTVALIPPTQ